MNQLREHDPLLSLADELRTHIFGSTLVVANGNIGEPDGTGTASSTSPRKPHRGTPVHCCFRH